MNNSQTHERPIATTRRLWSSRSLALITLVWLILQIGGLFTPGLLDDVDSVYIQIAREMLARHDFVTPTIDGIRFFDKPPLMYWLAAGSMHLFGVHDWAARLPLAIGVLFLFFAVYALGLRLYAEVSPSGHPDRAALYAALATATALGPYLYTRFFIPDILITLWMALAVTAFLECRDRAQVGQSALRPSLWFGVLMGLDVLTKGFIGLVFPLAFVFLFLLIRRELRLLRKLHVLASAGAFLLIASPWHLLAALRNRAIAMPSGLGLPAHAGWAWFYLYNEHIARFLGRRIPHDYGQVPIPLFWLLLAIWLIPWAAFLPSALRNAFSALRNRPPSPLQKEMSSRRVREARSGETPASRAASAVGTSRSTRAQDAALATLLWAGIILGFFTLSSRQEYYHLPALPALALLVGALLASADCRSSDPDSNRARKQALAWSAFFLAPLGTLLFLLCGYFALTAHQPPPGADLYGSLNSNPALYNLSLGHVFDLTGTAMGFFRGPLLTVALGMLVLGPLSHLLRRRLDTYTANLAVAAGMIAVLLAAHEGLVRFYPILGSKGLAASINADEHNRASAPVLIDGELTSGSSLLFYLDNPVLLVNGRVNGPWFGSFWPDARPIFLDDAELFRMWHTRNDLYLMTYHPEQRIPQLCRFGPVISIATSGGKTVLRNSVLLDDTPAPDLCR